MSVNFFKKYTTMVDVFGQPITLKLNSERSSKTLFGGILTISLVCAMISIFWVFFMDVLQKTKPFVAIETQDVYPRPVIHLNKNTVSLAFGLTDIATGIINMPNYFQIAAKIGNNVNSANGVFTITPLPVRICTLDDFPKIDNKTFYDISLNAMYCVDNLDVSIFGYWNEDIIQYLILEVNFCINRTETDTCVTVDEIQSLLKNNSYYFNIFLMDSMINPQNHTYPISNRVLNLYKGIRGVSKKMSEVYIKPQTLNSDEGFIFQSLQLNNTLSFDYQELDDTDFDEDSMCLISFEVMTSNNYVIHHRTYKKVSDVLASVGGLASVFIFASKMLCYLLSIYKQDEQILNKIFDYDFKENISISQLENNLLNFKKLDLDFDLKKNKNKILKLKNDQVINDQSKDQDIDSSIIKMQLYNNFSNLHKEKEKLKQIQIYSSQKISKKTAQISNKFNYNNIDERVTTLPLESRVKIIPKNNVLNLDENKKQIKEQNLKLITDVNISYSQVFNKILQARKNNRINMSYFDLLKTFMCKCLINKKLGLKISLYNKSKKKLDEILDITNIIHKVEEYDKFKMILLSKEQIALFNFIAKDIISFDAYKTKANKLNEMKEFVKNKDNLVSVAVNYFEEINQKNMNAGEIDKRLVEHLNDEYKINCNPQVE